MTRLTYPQAMALADALECQPEIVATNGHTGEIHLLLPNFTTDDATAFIEVCTGGLHVDRESLIITSDTVEGSEMPCARVVIHTEN